jgi:choline dehydrogenase-like flavoprotein
MGIRASGAEPPPNKKPAIPVIHRGWAASEPVMDSWVNEVDSPYTEIKPFTWWRSYQLGGRSILWGRQSYRWSDLDYEANAKEGVGVDWPIRYKDIAPWYDHVEKFAGISGSMEGLPAFTRWPVPATDGTELRGERCGGTHQSAIQRRPPFIHWPRGKFECTYRGPHQLPVPFALLGRLPVWRVFQHTIFYFACGDENK